MLDVCHVQKPDPVAGNVAQLVECLLLMHEAQGSIFSVENAESLRTQKLGDSGTRNRRGSEVLQSMKSASLTMQDTVSTKENNKQTKLLWTVVQARKQMRDTSRSCEAQPSLLPISAPRFCPFLNQSLCVALSQAGFGVCRTKQSLRLQCYPALMGQLC